MRLLTSLMIFAASTLAAVADPPSDAQIEAGRLFITETCAGCHATGVEGESPNPESPAFRFLGRRYPIIHLEEAFAEGIAVGHPGMPEFTLEPDQIAEVIAYLTSIQR